MHIHTHICIYRHIYAYSGYTHTHAYNPSFVTNTDELIYSACCSPHIVAEVKTTCYNMTAVIRAFGGAGPDAQDRVFRLNYKYARTPAARQTDRQTDTHTHTHTHTHYFLPHDTDALAFPALYACMHALCPHIIACMHARTHVCMPYYAYAQCRA